MPAQSLAGGQLVAAMARQVVTEEEEASPSGASAAVSVVASGTEARLGGVPGRGFNLANLTPSNKVFGSKSLPKNLRSCRFFSIFNPYNVCSFVYKQNPEKKSTNNQ